jgi:hypothetical protein
LAPIVITQFQGDATDDVAELILGDPFGDVLLVQVPVTRLCAVVVVSLPLMIPIPLGAYEIPVANSRVEYIQSGVKVPVVVNVEVDSYIHAVFPTVGVDDLSGCGYCWCNSVVVSHGFVVNIWYHTFYMFELCG